LFLDESAKKLKELVPDVQFTKASTASKMELLKLQGVLQKELSMNKDYAIMKGISLLAGIMKMHYSLELLETQGLVALQAYFNKLYKDSLTSKTKAVQNIVADLNYRSARILVDSLVDQGKTHPKMERLRELVADLIIDGKKAIIFNNYRDNAKCIVEELNVLNGIKAELFVGQAKKNGVGMSQKEQIESLNRFRNDEFNVVVMTSVGEEGIDIPKVDYVIFYEPVSSAIRHIQNSKQHLEYTPSYQDHPLS